MKSRNPKKEVKKPSTKKTGKNSKVAPAPKPSKG